MSLPAYRSPEFRLWAFHVVFNALPSGIIACHFKFNQNSDILAMAAVTAAFIVAAPLTPLWPLLTRASEWGKAVQIALWIRTVLSMVALLIIFRPRNFAILASVELLSGARMHSMLSELSRMTNGLLPAEGVIFTALLTLLTGLALLGVAGIVAVIVRVVRWLANGM